VREPAGSVPIDPRIRDQLRRVRWRRRLREAQRAVYVVVAVAATSAAAVVLAALRGGTLAFEATLVPAAAATAIATAIAVRALWRRRLSRDLAAAWIDDAAGLRGALATLVTVRRPGPLGDLLAARNLTQLRRWTPERVVPAVVPVAAGVAAAIGLGALALVVGLAPALRPPMPALTTVEAPLVPVDASGFPSRPDRLLVGTTEPDGDGGTHDGRPVAGTDDGAGAGGGASWPTLVQERVRRTLWGEEWDRVRNALARAAAAGGTRSAERPERAGDGPARDRAGGDGVLAAAGSNASAERRAGSPDDDAYDRGGGAGTGAGDGTDSNLFGAAADELQAGADPFALALAARVRTQHSGPRPPSGETPDASPDERPSLAERQRREDPAHRMTVPVAYEPIVRALFAHDEATP
jgi:hypothetical protein